MKPHLSKRSGKQYSIDFYNGEGKKTRRSVGKFILECFLGLCPIGLEALHNDGNSTNNNLQNLRFGTSKQNSADSLLHGYVGKIRQTREIKLTDDQVEEIKEFYIKNNFKYGMDTLLSKKYKVSREHIRDIRKGNRRTLKPLPNQYKEQFRLVKLKSVEYLQQQHTYDITVEDDHSYVVNGIVTHNTNRYTHIGIANIPRASSIYGKEMRSLFGAGDGFVQLGFDFSSLENRIQGNYVFNGTDGQLLAERLIADKPHDLHTINAEKLGITRTDAKSFTYAILYGASPKKVAKMLNCSMERAEQLVKEFWEAVPALNELKLQKEQEWLDSGKKYIRGIDGRKINIRSQHSILNALFQSGGVIGAKYTNIILSQKLEKMGYNIDCFKGRPDVAEMISYHDEEALAVSDKIIKYRTFKTEEDGKEFIKNWNGSQLGELNFVKQWYVALPNPVSEAILESIDEVGKILNLNVPLGIGWAVGKNWYQTH